MAGTGGKVGVRDEGGDGDVVDFVGDVVGEAVDVVGSVAGEAVDFVGDVVVPVEDFVADAAADITEDYVWDVLATVVVDVVGSLLRDAGGPEVDPVQIDSAFREAFADLLREGVAPSAEELVAARERVRRQLGIRRRPT